MYVLFYDCYHSLPTETEGVRERYNREVVGQQVNRHKGNKHIGKEGTVLWWYRTIQYNIWVNRMELNGSITSKIAGVGGV